MSGESFRDLTELDAQVDRTADDLNVIACVTVSAHTADLLQWNAMKKASTLFGARLDDGIWYGKASDFYRLDFLIPGEAVEAADARDGWVATFRIGLVPVG